MLKVKRSPIYLLSLAALFVSFESTAHPVTFESGIAVSTTHQRGFNLWHANYSLNSKVALGIDYLNLNHTSEKRLALARANFLVKRWFGKGRQGNVYILSGIGLQLNQSPDTSLSESLRRPLAMIGAQVDYETRRFYTALLGRLISDQDFQSDAMTYHVLYRMGLAPYTSLSQELQAWFVAQVSMHSGIKSEANITLLMRFFHKTALWEIGADTQGHPWIHLMSHF